MSRAPGDTPEHPTGPGGEMPGGREVMGGRTGGGICAPSLHVGRCEAGTELGLRCPKLQLRSSVLQLHP